MNEINRKIAGLAVPAVASNITVPLLGLCDTAVTGHLGSESYLAAIAAGGMMLNVVFWVFGFLRMGTTGLTAEAYGASDSKGVSCVFSRAVALALVAGLLIVAVQWPLSRLLLAVIGADGTVSPLAARYFSICIWGAPALLVTLTLNGWFIGIQNTVWPMVVSISVNIINVICSLVAVFGLGLGFEGVAYGTLTANWTGLVIAGVVVIRFAKGMPLWCGWDALWHGGRLRKFFNVSVDLFLRSSCIMLVTLAVTAYGARLGALTLAVNAVMMQFFVMFSYFMDGLAYSGEALCGHSAGASDRLSLLRAVRALAWWSVIVAGGFTLVYWFLSRAIVGLLTDVDGVRDGVMGMRHFLVLIPVVSAAAFLFDGFFIGLTATRRMLVTTFAAAVVFFAIIYLGPSGNPTLWTAFLAYLLARGVGLAAQMKRIVDRRFE